MTAAKAILTAGRRLIRHWRTLAVMAATYAALLATLYLFVATSEATLRQVILTLVFAALAPALFFLLQAMIVNYARGEGSARVLLRRSVRDSCRLALASLPLVLLAVVSLYLLHKLQSYFSIRIWPAPETTARATSSSSSWPDASPVAGTGAANSLRWSVLLITTLRFLLVGVILPLAAAAVWNLIAGDGLLPAVRKLRRNLARAFAPDAVRIYALGLLLFAGVPYFLLFSRTPTASASVEFGLFVTRLLFVFIFTLCGWILTLDALTRAGSLPLARELNVQPIDSHTA